MQSPNPLELSQVTRRRFLILYLKLSIQIPTAGGGDIALTIPCLHMLQLLSGQAQRQLVAPPLVLEPVDAPQGLRDGDVEHEVAEGEECYGSPAVSALETGGRGLYLSGEDDGEEYEEEHEDVPHLFLLLVYSLFLLQCLLEVELDNGVQCLDCGFFSYNRRIPFIVRRL